MWSSWSALSFKHRFFNLESQTGHADTIRYIKHYFSLLGYNVDAFSEDEENGIVKIDWFYPYGMKDWMN